MMKKIILIISLFFILSFTFGEDFLISETTAPDSLKGNTYFPLFVGAKWTWGAKGIKNIKSLNWEITSAYLINNNELNINNLLAFKIKVSELNEEWYVFENDGYLCYLKDINGIKKIEKILPLDPRLENEWMNDNDKYNVASIEDNMIKVEFISEDATRYGYLMFIKDIGPYEIFEISTASSDSKDLIMTITDNLSYNEYLELKNKNNFVKIEEKKESTENKEEVKAEAKKEPVKVEEKTEVKEIKKEEAKTEEKKELIKNKEEVKIEAKKEPDKNIVKEKEAIVIEKEKTKSDILNDKEIPKEIYLESLVKNKKYIQIGAYKIIYYAKEKVDIAKNMGFKAKIFKDKDGFYKVVIEYTGNEKDILNKIKKSIEPDAFTRQK